MIGSDLRGYSTEYGDKLTVMFKKVEIVDCVFNRALLLMFYGCHEKSDELFIWLRTQLKYKSVRENLREFLREPAVLTDQIYANMMFGLYKPTFDLYYGLSLIWYCLNDRSEVTSRLISMSRKQFMLASDEDLDLQYSNLYKWQKDLIKGCGYAIMPQILLGTKQQDEYNLGGISILEIARLQNTMYSKNINKEIPRMVEDFNARGEPFEELLVREVAAMEIYALSLLYVMYTDTDFTWILEWLNIDLDDAKIPPRLHSFGMNDRSVLFCILVSYALRAKCISMQNAKDAVDFFNRFRDNVEIPTMGDFIYQESVAHTLAGQMYINALRSELDLLEDLGTERAKVVELSESEKDLYKKHRKLTKTLSNQDREIERMTKSMENLRIKAKSAEEVKKLSEDTINKSKLYDELLEEYNKSRSDLMRLADLEEQVIKLKKNLHDMEETKIDLEIQLYDCKEEINKIIDSADSQVYSDEITDLEYSILNGKRIAIRGAHASDREAISRDIRKMAPGCVINTGSKTIKHSTEGIYGCDLLFLLVRCMAHTEYWKVRDEAAASNVPLLYNNTSFSVVNSVKQLVDYFRKAENNYVSETN